MLTKVDCPKCKEVSCDSCEIVLKSGYYYNCSICYRGPFCIECRVVFENSISPDFNNMLINIDFKITICKRCLIRKSKRCTYGSSEDDSEGSET